MVKKVSIFKRLKNLHANNPTILWAVGWVTFLPSVGTLLSLNLLYAHHESLDHFQLFTLVNLLFYVCATSIIMGLALMPTTLLAVVSGFMYGWFSFPFLVAAYSMASIIGYGAGRKLDKNSLEFLLNKYPKAAQLISDKREKASQLIFFVRLSPVIPFALSNLLFALLKIPLAKVIWVGLWGMLPRTLMAFSTGVLAESLLAALEERNGTAQIFLLLALVLISGWGIYLFFRNRLVIT